ncbi:uncharacterized protein B0I36DRAFT_342200 [Microdochium trichocladiopsis]|uniref:Uncharacterized protein n=1 Tax=Microdochium trichocladiopsis TaxID=1682393 RepID=A0A9P8XPM0_9PEZI|nr:uncharacterized protein B0I36DRAFT_342200 [Microdochium trichocladiopsis]KAH7009381.1 hypothetical protein B0I36DRAFT_342200 [Microdochium trichocladiopsis]
MFIFTQGFSPAEVLSHLIEHRLFPENAVTNVEAWIARIREDKQKAKYSWVHNAPA